MAGMRFALRAPRLLWIWILALGPLATPVRADERLVYTWKLDGWLGSLAAVFVPARGDGVLSSETLPGGRLRSELLITSGDSRAGDFFRYGAEVESASGRTLVAWSDLVWRGEKKSKRAEVDAENVVDMVSAIASLRRNPPAAPRRLEIWSDGRLYPVVVVPHGRERRQLAGRPVEARHFEVLGVAVPQRKLWKGQLELWIADDPHATPVEIVVARKGARVRLVLVDPPGAPGRQEKTKGGNR